MFCSKCGTDNPENANFCIKCGNSLNFFTVDESKNLNTNSQTVSAPPKTKFLSEIDTCNSLMILGLIFSILNFIPYMNFFTCIISFVLVIIGMNKVIKFASDFTSINGEDYKIEQMVRRLRLHYILSIVVSVVLLGLIIGCFITIIYAAPYSSDGAYEASWTILVFLLIVLFCYNLGIQLWAFVRWFLVKDFLSAAKIQINGGK